METFFQVSSISGVIQLAVAPVFLLAGISGTLMVLSTRLGRIVDRGRFLRERKSQAGEDELREIKGELNRLDTRAFYTNWAITLGTCCALLICLVIVSLFIGAMLNWNATWFIAVLFIAAMLCLITAFIFFLKEITLSTSAFRFRED